MSTSIQTTSRPEKTGSENSFRIAAADHYHRDRTNLDCTNHRIVDHFFSPAKRHKNQRMVDSFPASI